MKKIILILLLFTFTGITVYAQDNNDDDRGGKLQQRMREYVQKRLNLSKNEAAKFSPIFLRYITDLRKTHRENINDKPLLQLKVAELRLQYRNEFRQVLDEQRANKVFDCQREFENKIIDEMKNRQLENRSNRNRIHSMLQ